VLARKMLTLAVLPIKLIQYNRFSLRMGIAFYKNIIARFPESRWAHERIIHLLGHSFFRSHSLEDAIDFLHYFHPYLKQAPDAILKWRLHANHAAFLLQDQSTLQKMMQQYIDTQRSEREKHQLDFINFRLANNILTANYSTHAYLDTHIKAMQLGWSPKKRIVALMDSCDLDSAPNPTMLQYWRKYVDIVTDPKAKELLLPFAPYAQDDLTYTANLNGKGIYIEYAKCIVQEQWEKEGRPPLLQLEQDDIAYGRDMMRTIGLPSDAWFVALHVRDAGYKTGSYLGQELFDDYRNADITTYCNAIKAIVDRGGYVVRVGDPKMRPINPMKGLIDYAHSTIRSNRLDIYLFTQCRFFLGTSSGPILTPILFGVPVVGTNYAPLSARLHTGKSLIVHKLVRNDNTGSLISFKEALSSNIGKAFTLQGYQKNNLSLIDNSSEDILSVTEEMLDTLDGFVVYSEKDEALQEKANKLYREFSGYGALGRIGRIFLKRTADMGLL